MTFALGAAFPLALATASGGAATVGGDAARVYAANTVGAIAGSLAAGFVLVPRFGLQATFVGTSRVGAHRRRVAIARRRSCSRRRSRAARGGATSSPVMAAGCGLARSR